MKRNLFINCLAAVMLAFSVNAAEKIEAGPRGGRLLQKEAPRAEFFVEKDRTVSIAFYDEKNKQVAPGKQTITVIAEAKDGKKKLEFERKGELLVSTKPLPEGDGYTMVVQLRQSLEAKPTNYRIVMESHTCEGCNLVEYACICDE
ncbi:MAG: hypothetical protein ACO1QB_04455 [Verrucomicrobiales bacterium]